LQDGWIPEVAISRFISASGVGRNRAPRLRAGFSGPVDIPVNTAVSF
jgi:hypothetical protein